MTYTIDTVQDLVRVLDEHPQWLDALRSRLLPPAILRLPEQLAELTDKVNQLSEEMRQFRAATERQFESIERRFESIERRFDQQDERFDQQDQRFDRQDQRFDQQNERFDRQDERFDRQDERFDRQDERFDQQDQRFDAHDQRLERVEAHLSRVIDDLGPLKGAHAGDAARREAGLIALDLGLRYRKSLSIMDLVGLSDAADITGIAANELRSFHRADLVAEAGDRKGECCYVAVEASFTVNGRDSSRAIRNAGLLARFTGCRSYAVVAGVRRDDRIQARIDAGEVFWYQLTPDALQAD